MATHQITWEKHDCLSSVSPRHYVGGSMRDKLIDTVGSIPYPLRLVALVLFFNGMFALIKLATILIGNDVELDWRIVNMIIGFGLITKRRIWYIAACVSVVVSAILHVKSIGVALSNYQVFSLSGTLYFIVALVLDLGMLYILLHHPINMKGNS